VSRIRTVEEDFWDLAEGTLTGLFWSIVSGFLLFFAFPPAKLWFLAWIALVPMLYAQHHVLPVRISWLGPSVTLGLFLTLHFAKVETGFAVAWQDMDLPLGFILVRKDRMLCAVFLLTALVTSVERKIHIFSDYSFLVFEPTAYWVGLEYLRDLLPGVGTSAAFGYSQFSVGFLVRIASLIGIFGVSAAVLLGNSSFLCLALAFSNDDRSCRRFGELGSPERKRLMRQGILGFSLLFAVILAGNLSFFIQSQEGAPYRVSIGVVQPGPLYLRDTPGEGSSLGPLRDLTLEAVKKGAEIVVWPEATFHSDPRLLPAFSEIQNLAQEVRAYLVVPYFAEMGDSGYSDVLEGPGQEPQGSQTSIETGQEQMVERNQSSRPLFVNEALLISPQGEVLGAGVKDHPVTVLGETSLTRGAYPVFDTPFGEVGIMICYDLNFTDTARKLAMNGADLICVPSNDWQGVSHFQYTFAVFRAVETGTAIAKADTRYDSCIVSPGGQILSKRVSRLGETWVSVEEVQLIGKKPPALYLTRLVGALHLVVWLSLAFKTLVKRDCLKDRV